MQPDPPFLDSDQGEHQEHRDHGVQNRVDRRQKAQTHAIWQVDFDSTHQANEPKNHNGQGPRHLFEPF